MFSSTHRTIVCVLIIVITAVLTQSQSVPVKEINGTISGKVAIKGKPAPGISIGLRPTQHPGRERPTTTYKATTDINGEYRIANVAPGNYFVIPLAPAFVNTEDPNEARTLILNKGETIEHFDFALVKGSAITGKVVDADGRPLIEEEVEVFANPNNDRAYPTAQALTDDRGIYRVYGLKAGNYKVAAGRGDEGSYGQYETNYYKRTYHPSVSDAAQATVIEVSEGGEATNVDITMGRSFPTYSASGRIVDSDTGQPLPNVGYGLVHFVTANHRSSMSSGAVTNSRGEFKLDNLGPGKYAVFIRPGSNSNLRAEEVQFEIVDDDVSGLLVRTHKGAMISGTVVLEGTDDKGAREDLRRTMLTAFSQRDDRAASMGSSAWTMINADGSFTLSGLAGGTAVLNFSSSTRFRIARVERNGVIQPRGVEIRDGEEVTGVRVFVNYGNASLRGVIEPSGTLPPGARYYVQLRNVADDPTMGSSPSLYADVDARGQFVIEGLVPGTYEVHAGIVIREARMYVGGSKKQQVVVTAGQVTNITVPVEINQNVTRP